ncbi:MAG: hypothetical protein HYZ14_15305 [Bacteroidetes bacterium]|nr:hypothetical protein [Bacteroidota bacterium]
MFKPTIRQVKKVFSEKGYLFYEGGKPYHLNIIGIRSASLRTDIFNETLMVIFEDDLEEQLPVYFPCTTKPGLYYLKNPLKSEGYAITAEGQYVDAFIKRKHNNQYDALCQNREITFYRDANKNEVAELMGVLLSGSIGLNIHREAVDKVSQHVGTYSTGCAVIQSGFDAFMFLVNMAIKNHGNKFTYTLINEADFYPKN